MSLVTARHIFRQKNTLLAIALASFSSISWATYSDVNAMLEALRPNAPVIAPQLNTLILSLDGLNPIPIQRRDALFTLAPAADGSLRMVSDAAMHEMHATIFDRVQKYKEISETKTGIACGDQRLAFEPKAYWSKKKTDLAPQQPTATKTATTAPVAEKATATKTATTDDLPSVKSNDDVKANDKAKVEKPKSEADVKAKKDTKATAEVEATSATTSTPETTETPAVDLDTPLISDILNEPRGAWMQILGADTYQYDRNNVPGYHGQMLGMIIGRDIQINDGLFIGIAGGYQQGDIDTIGLSGSYLDVKRYNGTLYGRFDFSDMPIFVQMALTLALNNYDNNRYILVPPAAGFGFVNIAHGEFDGWETNAHLETGYTFTCRQIRLIPKVILEYSHMEFNNYEEHDAFFLDLNVKYDNINAFDLGIGAQIEYRNDFDKVAVIPEAHLYVYHDFINANQVATANFYSGGYAFLSEGARAASNSVDLGVSMNVHSNNQTMVKIQYDYVTRSDYHRNEAFIKLRYEWV